MLGDKIFEASGRTTGTRVLPGDDYRYVKIETSIEGQGRVLGMEAMGMATFTSFERVPGQMYAEGQGMVYTSTGDGAIWNGHGVGRIAEDGSVVIRYSVAYQADVNGKLAALNGALAVGEFESKADGSWTTAEWQWK